MTASLARLSPEELSQRIARFLRNVAEGRPRSPISAVAEFSDAEVLEVMQAALRRSMAAEKALQHAAEAIGWIDSAVASLNEVDEHRADLKATLERTFGTDPGVPALLTVCADQGLQEARSDISRARSRLEETKRTLEAAGT